MKKFIKSNFSSKNNSESKKTDFNERFEFRNFVDYAAVGIFKLNMDTVIEYANQTFAQILDFKSRTDLIGINLKDELISDSADWEKIRAKLHKHRVAKNFIIPLKQNSGASIFVRIDIRSASDEDGNSIYFEGTVIDVSEFLNSERILKREIQLLKEGDVGSPTASLESKSIISKYLSDVVHKIKKPINSIVGFLTLIEKGLFNSEDELKDFTHKARISASSLVEIVDGINENLNKELFATPDSTEMDEKNAEDDENVITEEIASTQESDDGEANNDKTDDDNLTEQPQEHIEQFEDEQESTVVSNGEKILLVEDNPISQNVEMNILKKSGYSVVAVTNGEDAVEAVKTNEFSLILMDVEMPNMDGITATKIIRKLESSVKQIPIIAVTAHSSMKDREKCLASGMNDYIAKPININFMKMTIDQWLKKKVQI